MKKDLRNKTITVNFSNQELAQLNGAVDQHFCLNDMPAGRLRNDFIREAVAFFVKEAPQQKFTIVNIDRQPSSTE